MRSKHLIGIVFVVVVLAGFGFGAWRYVVERGTHSCRACSRPVHQHSDAVAVVDGKRGHYCCPACALSEHRQSGKPVQVVELTDHLTGRKLDPANAVVVRNSDVNPCLQHKPMVTPDKQPMHTHFDRCSPSILVFASRAAADGFTVEHGGQVLRFSEVAEQYRR